ncbi:two-component system, OmpR family, sensor histidine kinase BaeS [Streptomyces sp. 3213]|uniref:HAMP domain-containing sensor histidine kinase n=1 Tax=Streptomyces sp. 3213.3 TaxID=1855348 RepID=UPI000899244E|nr:HAMP domain-containing sensor histidine kinase [Streptomyces sp. 3213.3]SEE95773.1 two-component system, OmpR family, sensor histidine kinase BaeS [Streptomyces sp. 3213] [Streptomyces sp. 3213.3]
MRPRIPLRKRLLVRLLVATVLIALCSVGATAWLAVETTTRAIREEQGQDLADDMRILAQLSGYAATHPDWKGVAPTVRALSKKMGRRIALTTSDRTLIADSAPHGTSLPPRAAASVDPLHTDTYTEPGAQLSGLDPRVVGPYRVTTKERARLMGLAKERRACFAQAGIDTTITMTPSGRPVLTDADGNNANGYVPDTCADGKLNALTVTESKALKSLLVSARPCLEQGGLTFKVPYFGVDVFDKNLGSRYTTGVYNKLGDAADTRKAQACTDDARRAQLDPYVAPVAELFLGGGDTTAPRFDVSPANKAKVVGAAAAVLALTVLVTAVVATRLVRPLRALTEAAQQPPELHVRVPVRTRDETGILAEAFNDLADRRERMEAQRKAMVSDIAHELRSPLTNIRGWLEVTRDGFVEPDPALLGSLHEEAMVLQRVIDDLQDLAAADAGTLRLHREPVRVEDLFDQVAAAYRVTADTARVVLLTKADRTLWLDADPVRMRQVLGNLVSNALRHTPVDGTVTLTAWREGDRAVLTVTDTGTGIAPEDLPHVFERFWRADQSRSRRTGGSGLGLSIVRDLAAAHDGTVEATSEPGAGSVFTLRLPDSPSPEGS